MIWTTQPTHTYPIPPNIHIRKHLHNELRPRVEHEEAQRQQHHRPHQGQLGDTQCLLGFLLLVSLSRNERK